jgi:A/G-specific adenine glycosylase
LPAAEPIVTRIEHWFERSQRLLPWRATYDPYLVWVSEVMLQQTRMEVVLRYFDRFLGPFPTIAALAAAGEEEVLTAWSGLGYYRRARMLRQGAIDVVQRFHGALPATVEELLTIPGIGRYTAGAISSIAFGRRAPIVDGNVARILARVTGRDGLPAAWKKAGELVARASDPRAFNQGLMELGALVCKPQNPECARCPISRHCVAFREDRIDSLPAPKPRSAAKVLTIPLYVIVDGRGRVLMRREQGALMNAMLHLPHGSTELLSGSPLRVIEKNLIATFRHTITTRRISFRLLEADLRDSVRDGSPDYVWIAPADLPNVPHPSYVTKAMRLIALQSPACAGG